MVEVGNAFLCQMLEAIPEAVVHYEDFAKFTSGLRVQRPADVVAWGVIVEEWEADILKPNPYALPKSKITLANVYLKLAKEEQARIQEGQDAQSDISLSSFLLLGMELEEQQCSLHRLVRGELTTLQDAMLQEQHAALLKKIL
ncbi:hypothetical protein SCP_0300500 [Sparassis crispa]|uniref:Uncharacterized protein n=1 Tax=Sparassis crispa TaxID=139825 RepID=A0A401GDY7_9APHY|nr:hypothetical protein SCP_0300500 [Sparassis crispa]GBE80335.1 hypothetical protein SCP_0300500 [Sparassis crispa]